MDKTNLELKYFCPDFIKIRELLREIKAKKKIVKNQTDYFFNLPNNNARLKLRLENNKKLLVHYKRPDFVKEKITTAKVKLYNVKDNDLLLFLSDALGVKAIVKKKREVWKKSNTVFHLDDVKNVGKIFEIELQKKNKITIQDKKQFKEYQNKFLPYLGKIIKGSNVDLIILASK